MWLTSLGGHTRDMRVLVVEDEARLALLLKRGLEEQGYAVDVTGDGAEALWLATEADFDAIVLDIMLPSLDGLEATRRLRAAGRWAPVLLLTAKDAIDDRVVGLDSGADDYLTKPFSFAELAARVRALVRRGRVERPTVLAVGDLRLDPARRQAWRGSAELELSPTEFSLLELFLAHPGLAAPGRPCGGWGWGWQAAARCGCLGGITARRTRPRSTQTGARAGWPAARPAVGG
jgi:two-component system, OmpR family, response regulator